MVNFLLYERACGASFSKSTCFSGFTALIFCSLEEDEYSALYGSSVGSRKGSDVVCAASEGGELYRSPKSSWNPICWWQCRNGPAKRGLLVFPVPGPSGEISSAVPFAQKCSGVCFALPQINWGQDISPCYFGLPPTTLPTRINVFLVSVSTRWYKSL